MDKRERAVKGKNVKCSGTITPPNSRENKFRESAGRSEGTTESAQSPGGNSKFCMKPAPALPMDAPALAETAAMA